MKISIITIFPEMYTGFLTTSIIKKAQLNGAVTIELLGLRDFLEAENARVDDYPYGGGNGMILRYEPLKRALDSIKTPKSWTIMLAPVGQNFTQGWARSLAQYEHLILICGHYEGFDERILSEVDAIMTIGDYILTGGELASMVISDAIIRLLPTVINEQSHQDESFETGLLEYPQYTRPQEINGLVVPEILLSGHHQKIAAYRLKESFKKTLQYRPALISQYPFNKQTLKILQQALAELAQQSKE